MTGSQTVDFDLFGVEHSKLIVLIGMNWICTKMPDAHWLAEARLRGSRVIVISADYMPTANKADEIVILRPGSDVAFLLGVAREMIANDLFDRDAVVERTDLPLLVRSDTGKLLDARDAIAGHALATLENAVVVRPQADIASTPPIPPWTAGAQVVPAELREAWGDYVVWDPAANAPAAVSRDEVGARMQTSAALEGTYQVALNDGTTIEARTVFSLLRDYSRASASTPCTTAPGSRSV